MSAEVSVELQSMDGTANAGRKYRALSCLGRRRGGGGLGWDRTSEPVGFVRAWEEDGRILRGEKDPER